MGREAEASGCWIKKMGVESWEFMGEQGISKGVSLSSSRWIAGQEGER